jgi:aminopeptidase
MKDPRVEKLADSMINYSLELQRGEILYLEMKGMESMSLGKALIRKATELGAIPFWFYNDESIERQWLRHASVEQMQVQAELHLELMKRAAAYVGIRGSDNAYDLADISQDQIRIRQQHFMKPVHSEERVKRTRWVVMRYPNNAMAQLAETSQEAFEDFYFNVCCLDYKKMSVAMDKLVTLMQATDRVRLVGPGTEINFSIKGIPAIKCDGKVNIPDGEVFTAPVRESVNGVITYNAPSIMQGQLFQNIRLSVKNGKIVEASCSGDNEALNKIFDIDEGARYFGEFAIGVNPFILHPMKDTLFDEKIAGSIHLTPGRCYDDAPNGNGSSALHWDLVLIQRPEYGGGEMWFDDRLIRKDGEFVDKDLAYAFSKENLSGNQT